jgi:hypothetical protein
MWGFPLNNESAHALFDHLSLKLVSLYTRSISRWTFPIARSITLRYVDVVSTNNFCEAAAIKLD